MAAFILSFNAVGIFVAIVVAYLCMLRYHKRLAAAFNSVQYIAQEKEDKYLPKSRPPILYASVIVGWLSMVIAESVAIWDMSFSSSLIFLMIRMSGIIAYPIGIYVIYWDANTISNMTFGVVATCLATTLCWATFIFAMVGYGALLGTSISILVSVAFAHHPIWLVINYRKADNDFLLNYLKLRKIRVEAIEVV